MTDSNTLWIAFGVSSLLSFLTFGWDKLCAVRGRRRVPEARLLLGAFCLGFPGAWLGVRVFHHKTKKASFLIRLALVTTLAVALLGFAVYSGRLPFPWE